ncbi:MAG: exodeoxyribonuclease VII small subunit, partial [Gemmatimonadota bacterium]|nr:exodeoxyribonuclease VII small subunit [Gemmatimonadota bacterium]
MSFEQTLARLEQIASSLDRDDLPLEEALRLFEEGIAKLREANAALGEA